MAEESNPYGLHRPRFSRPLAHHCAFTIQSGGLPGSQTPISVLRRDALCSVELRGQFFVFDLLHHKAALMKPDQKVIGLINAWMRRMICVEKFLNGGFCQKVLLGY